MPSNQFILCHPLLFPPSIFPSIRVFSRESVLSIRWPKYWSFSFSISPSNEYSELISFRIDWLDLLALEGHVVVSDVHQCRPIIFPNERGDSGQAAWVERAAVRVGCLGLRGESRKPAGAQGWGREWGLGESAQNLADSCPSCPHSAP